jgi:hypothetical protein
VPLSVDYEEGINEAIVLVLDTLPAIVALTGRNNGNVIPFDDLAEPVVPAIEYFVIVTTQIGGIGDTRRALLTFTATAEGKDNANALLHEIEIGLNAVNLLAAGLDACPLEFTRTGIPGRASDGTSSASMDVVLIVTR